MTLASITPGSRTLFAGSTPDWVTFSALLDNAPFGILVVDSQFRLAVLNRAAEGLAPEMLPHVFDLFMQAERASTQPGLGIGLALARRLMEMHGGEIEARSAGPGRGSRFTLRLPLASGVPRLSPAGAEAGVFARRVLVIDDNEDVADMTALLIRKLGGDSTAAYRAEEGLRRVLDLRPDIVRIDIGMPGMDGYEPCRRIRSALGPGVLLVALTDFGQEQDKERALSAGFDSRLTKPADPAILARLLAAPLPEVEPS
jgi:CheY-like chemotaxis protein